MLISYTTLTVNKKWVSTLKLIQAIETCYEEVPAVPQPAYTFSGLSPEDLRQALLIETLPGYQPDDPYKTDRPPPSYEPDSCGGDGEQGVSSRSLTIDDMVRDIETSDVSSLLQNQEDGFICMQQIT